jgi:hypothetical protein
MTDDEILGMIRQIADINRRLEEGGRDEGAVTFATNGLDYWVDFWGETVWCDDDDLGEGDIVAQVGELIWGRYSNFIEQSPGR